MSDLKKNKRWLSLLVAMMMILSFSLSVFAATPKSKTFYIRKSGTYNATGGTVTFTASGSNVNTSTSGTVTFNSYIAVDKQHEINPGTVYKYNISGGKITLTLKTDTGMFTPQKLVGKPHIKYQGGTLILWKIDSFGCGFYFRDT